MILSNTKGYIAANVGDGIGVPILSSISCLSNIGKHDLRTFSCSNLKGIALISIASKVDFKDTFVLSNSSLVSAVIIICIWKSNTFDWLVVITFIKFSKDS